MRMPEKCRNNYIHNNNNPDNPLTSCRTDGGKNMAFFSRLESPGSLHPLQEAHPGEEAEEKTESSST